ncbi:amidohydrolase family protein, partial [Streptomyces flavofungini]|uniref:amidohydrolase family protein n=1 Tax=Streptomyces flavofungini TaxID=68200 RepID=UPI0034DFB221
HTGQLQDDPDALADTIVDGHLAGWQLAVHAIGDRAADIALEALERAQRLRPRPGARLVGSSDRPVTDGSPLRAIQFMVERTSESGQAIGPAESLTVDEALHAYTVAGAYACHWENSLGTLTPGKRADLAVLGDDPRSVDVSRIGDIEVAATSRGGGGGGAVGARGDEDGVEAARGAGQGAEVGQRGPLLQGPLGRTSFDLQT